MKLHGSFESGVEYLDNVSKAGEKSKYFLYFMCYISEDINRSFSKVIIIYDSLFEI